MLERVRLEVEGLPRQRLGFEAIELQLMVAEFQPPPLMAVRLGAAGLPLAASQLQLVAVWVEVWLGVGPHLAL